MKILKKIYPNLPYIFIAVITSLYILLALLRHLHFMTYGYDLAIYDQQVWLYSKFKNPFLTIEYKSALLNHFSPSLALFAPFYWIWSDPKVLLILQALMIGLSAIPLDILAKRKNLPVYLRCMLIISYLTFYGCQYAVNFDVHSLVYGTTLIPWLILLLEDRKYKKAAILMLIIMGMKESFPVTTTLIGAAYFLKGQRKLGSIIIASSLTYLLLALKVIQPIIEHFTGEFYRFTSSPPISITDLFTRLVDTSSKREVWYLSFLWYALIPLAAPILVLTAIGDIAFYFILGNHHPETLTIYMHYRSSLAPLLSWAAIDSCVNIQNYINKLAQSNSLNHFLQRVARRIAPLTYAILSLLLALSFTFFQYTYHLPLNSLTKSYWYQFPQHLKDKTEVLAKAPANVPIATQNNLAPHLSERTDIHLLWPYRENGGYLQFPICRDALLEATYGRENLKERFNNECPSETLVPSPCGNEFCYWLRFHRRTEYLVTDTTPGQNAVELLMENEEKLKEGLKNLETTGIISPIEKKGDAILWKVNISRPKRVL